MKTLPKKILIKGYWWRIIKKKTDGGQFWFAENKIAIKATKTKSAYNILLHELFELLLWQNNLGFECQNGEDKFILSHKELTNFIDDYFAILVQNKLI